MPGFASLGFADQADVRRRVLQSYVADDEGFLALSSAAKRDILEKVVYRPPVMEDPKRNEEIQRVHDGFMMGEAPEDAAARATVGDEALVQQGQMPNSLAAARREMMGTIFQAGFFGVTSEPGSLMHTGTVAGRAMVKLADYPARWLLGEDSALPSEMAYGTETRKMVDYYTYLMGSSNYKGTRMMGTWTKFVGEMGGMVADFMLTRKAYAEAFSGVVGELATKTARQITSPVMTSIVKRFFPLAAETTYEGLVGVFREMGSDKMDDPDARALQFTQEGLFNVLRDFGQYAAFDYLIAMGASVVAPLLGGVGRVLGKGYGQRAGKIAGLGDDEYKEALGRFIRGHMTDSELDLLPKQLQDHFAQMRTAQSLDGELFKVPWVRTQMAATNLGVTVGKLDDGTYRLGKVHHPEIRTFESETLLRRQMIDDALDAVKDLPPEEADVFLRGADWIRPYRDAPDTVNGFIGAELAGLRPAAVKKGARTKYVSARDRTGLTAGEITRLETQAKHGDVSVLRFSEDVLPGSSIDDSIERGRIAFKDGDVPRVFKADETVANGNVAVIVNRTAPPDMVKMADDFGATVEEAHPGVTAHSVSRTRLMEEGFDSALTPTGDLEVFYPSLVRYVDDRINPNTGKVGSRQATRNRVTGTPDLQATIRTSIAGKLTGEAMDTDRATVVALLDRMGVSADDTSIREVSALLLDQLGDDAHLAIRRMTGETWVQKGLVTSKREGNLITLLVPDRFASVSAKKSFVRNLVDRVTAVGKKTEGIQTPKKPNYRKMYTGKAHRYTPPGASLKEQQEWIKELVTNNLDGKLGQDAAGGYWFQIGKGTPETFETLEDLYTGVARSATSKGQLRTELLEQGYHLRQGPGRLSVVSAKTGEQIPGWEGTTPYELMKRMDYVPERVDGGWGPQLAEVTSDGKITVTGGTISGSPAVLRKYMDGFADTRKRELRKVIPSLKEGTELYEYLDTSIELVIPRMKFRKHFASVKKAQQYLTDELPKLETMNQIAYSRGMSVDFRKGKLVVYGTDGAETIVNTMDEVGDVLAQVPDPEWAPPILPSTITAELAEVTEAMVKPHGFAPMPQKWNTSVPGRSDKLKLRTMAAEWVQPRRDWLQTALTETNNPDVLHNWRSLDRGLVAANTEIRRGEVLYQRMFRDTNGKTLKQDRRELLFGWVESGMDRDYVARHKLTDREQAIGRSAHEAFDDLFKKFQIPFERYIQTYGPRVRKYLENTKARVINHAGSAEELLGGAFEGNRLPKELKFWAENVRTAEIADVMLDRDLMSVMLKYNSQGHKKLFMNAAWEKLYANMQEVKAAGKLPAQVEMNLNVYRQEIMGMTQTPGSKFVENFVTELFTKLGASAPKAIRAGKDAMRTMYGLSYLSFMGWRAWTPIRNMGQVFTTLAPRFGNRYTLDAIQEVSRHGDDIANYMRRAGMLQEAPPVIGEFLSETAWMQKVTKSGLRSFQNSDDWTRMVAFSTANAKWTEGLDKMKGGVLKMGAPDNPYAPMFRYTGVNLLHDSVQKEIAHAIKTGHLDTARDLFASTVIDETMFVYRTGQRPRLYRGLLGQLFGQFGTYAPNWVGNVVRGVTRGSLTQRAGYVAAFAANSLAIYGALQAVGINSNNFLPWSPAQFTGGPNFDYLMSATQMFGSGYASRQARSEIDRLLPVNLPSLIGNTLQGRDVDLKVQVPAGVPGYYAIKGLYDATKLMAAGEPWKAFLRFGSFPLRHED